MAKVKRAYFCKNCGFESPKWLGRCTSCGEWNTFTEEIISKESNSNNLAASLLSHTTSRPQRVGDIEQANYHRIDLGLSEVNRVLGGGMVKGSLILLGGEPGIGKSTLSLQIALADNHLKSLYVSGEESAEQIKMRADRLGVGNEECLIYPETLLENIITQIENIEPELVVIDSIQTIYTNLLESSAGSVSQIRECAATLLKIAKSRNISIIIIGHITKEGTIAGPKILEHIVDVVLQFEGDANHIYRILRGTKNRFGATFEIGLFEMIESGLQAVENPSEILLSHYDIPLSGIAVGAAVDGIRPYLIEVQALATSAAYGTPQRNATGYDTKRMNMLLAIIEKRVGLKMYQRDIFLNFAGGFKVADTGLDLSIIAAVISSYFDKPIAEGVCCAGEVGLSGEVRPATRTEHRISEAARLGFKKIIVSAYIGKGVKRHKGIQVVEIESIDRLAKELFS
ncbi:MAG: DNA repair protein RadA [Rikenellaceae bacterium]